ncbi:MAG: TonB-dependent receptor [Gemmatimonadetes bacterium]|nr:TonB-dependent receptor [Gemmatimonadota bacterium]
MWRTVSLYRPLLAALVAVPFFLLPTTLHAQAQATTGIIRGVVSGPDGNVMAGAAVVLRNVETNFQRSALTNERGIFVASLLPVGSYDVVARSPGFSETRRQSVTLRLGETVELALSLGLVTLAPIVVTSTVPLVDVARVEAATRLSDEVVSGLPNNGRNYLSLTLVTPNVAVVQGPDGDELSIGGQRGIYNNIAVDGADFNNPFFGEQRGGQRPPFTFNLDAVREMVVVAQGANAEFGRSAGGFVNVITKSGTNELHGSAHYFGQTDRISAELFGGGGNPDFTQHQFGFTLGGPIVRDRGFFFIAYDQQIFDQTKQTDPLRISDASLRTWMDTAYDGALADDYRAVQRTNDANALMVKFDWRLNPTHSLSLKYNYTNSRQENGTFDVDTWARSANAIERDFSHAVNGSLVSQLRPNLANEFRFQYSREDRPRPYEGPTFPDTDGSTFRTDGRPFPDTGADFGNGYRWGMPFFIPITAYDTRIQVLDNLSVVRGNHLFKIGAEWNRTQANQTFIGFANARYIFSSVDGFLNYVRLGPTYVECLDGSASGVGASCGGPFNGNWGPLLLFLQIAPVQSGQTIRDVGTQSITQNEFALYVQDTWKPRPNLTVNYGLRWEAQIEPDPITPPDQVFFQPFIGQTIGGYRFPSDGTIPSDYGMIQPRLGIAWDVNGDGRQVVRASAGLYYARTPGLVLASTRTSNGSVGQTVFRSSDFLAFGVTPPAYGPTLPSFGSGTPDHPSIFVTAEDFRNPRTAALNASYERELRPGLAGMITYSFARTTRLNRFVDRNAAVFGSPFASFPGDASNGLSTVTTLESTAKSQYHGFTLSLNGSLATDVEFQANYTLSFDKSDDDNERDPFSFRYASADQLDREYNWSDRDQRHRVNIWLLARIPGDIYLNNRVSYYSKQPTSESCGAGNQGTGEAAAVPSDRICADGSILLRNTIRKDNDFFSWDLRVSRPFDLGTRGTLEAVVEVFNLLNRENIRNPSAPALLFNFDGTIRSGFGDPRRVQAGLRWAF